MCSSNETFQAIVHELCPAPAAVDVFRCLVDQPHAIFLDSALTDAKLGRYSFVSADPIVYLESPADGRDALSQLQSCLAACPQQHQPDLPPFQGGAAGLLSYDLGRSLERIPTARYDEFQLPALAVGIYDVVVAFDHQRGRCWLIAQGWPEVNDDARHARARMRLAQFLTWISRPTSAVQRRNSDASPLDVESISRHFPIHRHEGLLSNFDREGYLDAVQRAIDYIVAGDLFQVNLSQRLICRASCGPVELYVRLRQQNPATFAAFFDGGSFQLVSASPERFLTVHDGYVEARPIKGTRPRPSGAEAALFMGDELRNSEKDRAENVMIVDLMRNDLSRVCRPESVRVGQLCEVESYAFVQHLVSSVTGTLAEGRSPIDLLRASFPGGSITGAPKVRAMEIIAELEPHARGAYCGSLGYIDSAGHTDLNILIRTITAAGGWWQFPVGGGVVAQSVPATEYAETWHKAEGMLRAIGSLSESSAVRRNPTA